VTAHTALYRRRRRRRRLIVTCRVCGTICIVAINNTINVVIIAIIADFRTAYIREAWITIL
jgi:hypothetical protein